MEKLGIGIIGCGSIARNRHIKELSERDDIQLVAFCDAVRKRALDMASRYGGKAYTDYQDVLKLSEVDAVFVLCHNNLHAAVSIAAMQAGKHVLCEKPMGITVQECQDMILAAKKTGRTLMVGYNQRLSPAHIKARELIRSGKYGRPITFRTTFGHRGCEYWALDGQATWFFKKEPTGFGASADLGVHKADLVRFLLDDDIVAVSAMAGVLNKRNENSELIEVDDNMIALLQTKSGMMGTLTASWTYAVEDNSTSIYLEKAVIKVFDNPEADLVIETIDGEIERYNLGGIQTNENQTKSGIPDLFIDTLQSGAPAPISGVDGMKGVKIILACLESAKKGCKINLN